MAPRPPKADPATLGGSAHGGCAGSGCPLSQYIGMLVSLTLRWPRGGDAAKSKRPAPSWPLPYVAAFLPHMLARIAEKAQQGGTLWALQGLSLILPCLSCAVDRRWGAGVVSALSMMIATNCLLASGVLYARKQHASKKGKKICRLLPQILSRLAEETSLKEQAQNHARMANAELVEAREGLSATLALLCDFVLQVDDDLRLEKPTQSVSYLLTGGQNLALELDGCSIERFMASPQDTNSLRELLSADTGAAGTSDSTAGVPISTSLTMKDARERLLRTEMFHTPIGGTTVPRLHVLGLRVGGHRAPLGAPRMQETLGDVKDMASLILDCCASERSVSTTSSVWSIAGPEDSRLAFPFDAGNNFHTLGQHWMYSGQATRAAPSSIAKWVDPKQRADFEDWVICEVQSSPWGGIAHSKFFVEPLGLTLPGGDRVVADCAWLEVGRINGSTLPATLWLQGITPSRAALQSQMHQEDDGYASSLPSIVADDSISVGGFYSEVPP